MKHSFKQTMRVFRGIPKRASNPYTTHLPILIGLSQLLTVERVLEFGCGEYSTLTFLDRAIFPDLVELHSFDDDSVWIDKITSLTQQDDRLTLKSIAAPIYSIVADIPFYKYDLVFIDDSRAISERAATIRAVVDCCHPTNVIIIHDFEVSEYRQAAISCKHQFAFTALNPQTGILWNASNIENTRLIALNSIVKQYARSTLLDDRNAWIKIMKAKM
jgi:hypothetical protein